MFACFVCIDTDNSLSIQKKEWMKLMNHVYDGKAYEDKLETIFY